jgi:hypothetical protein
LILKRLQLLKKSESGKQRAKKKEQRKTFALALCLLPFAKLPWDQIKAERISLPFYLLF